MAKKVELQNDIGDYLDALTSQIKKGEIGGITLTISTDIETRLEYGETRTGFPIKKIKITDTGGGSKTVFQR